MARTTFDKEKLSKKDVLHNVLEAENQTERAEAIYDAVVFLLGGPVDKEEDIVTETIAAPSVTGKPNA